MKIKTHPLRSRSPFAAFSKVERAVNILGQDEIISLEIEYLDKRRATVEEFADAGFSSHAQKLALEAAARIREEPGAQGETAVYVMGPADGSVSKIGVASSPLHRMAELQAGCWEPLQIHALFWIMEGSAIGVEQLSLRVAAKMDRKMRGEWVSLAPQGAAYVVASVLHSANVKAADCAMWLRNREAIRVLRSEMLTRMGEEHRLTPHLRTSSLPDRTARAAY